MTASWSTATFTGCCPRLIH